MHLTDHVKAELERLPRVTLHDLGRDRAAIVSFAVRGLASEAIRSELTQRAINVSVSKPNSTLLDASARNLPTVLRVSPHYYNSEDEIDLFVDALNDIVASG
nr:aminotransferase class V-fold PLP-dependent enzyme [Bradyrhizobium sp. CCH1-B1]